MPFFIQLMCVRPIRTELTHGIFYCASTLVGLFCRFVFLLVHPIETLDKLPVKDNATRQVVLRYTAGFLAKLLDDNDLRLRHQAEAVDLSCYQTVFAVSVKTAAGPSCRTL